MKRNTRLRTYSPMKRTGFPRKKYDWRSSTLKRGGRIRVKRDARLAAWSKAVRERDDFTCQLTGIRDMERNIAHHIAPRSRRLDLKYAPYAGIRQDGGKIAKEGQGGMAPYSDDPVDAWFTTRDQTNLGNMRDDERGFQAAISSPPYEASLSDKRDGDSARQRKAERYARGEFEHSRPDTFVSPKNIGAQAAYGGKYSLDPENVGNQRGDTFWSASRVILEQLYSVLSPGAHAIFIVKAFVRDKKIVDFPGQWAQLCEAVGFKLIHDHHAMLTEHSGTQGGMFGEDKEHKVKRVSFFRRLHEKKSPETAIEYENVLCFERP